MSDAIPPPAAVPAETQTPEPAPKTESAPPKKHGMERAKQAAIPSSIIGALLTAVTAIYQANDNSLEKKTYETLSKSMIETQADVRALNARMAVFEQALLVTAFNGHGVTASPAEAAPEPEKVEHAAGAAPRARPRTPARGRGALGALIGAEVPMRDTAVDNNVLMELVPSDSVAAPAPAQTQVEQVAEILGRKIEVNDGEVTVTPEPASATRKAAPLPDWNTLAK